MQLPEAYTQMDGPEEATRQSVWPETTQEPRKRGPSRVSAARQLILAIRFFGRVVPGLYLLLHL